MMNRIGKKTFFRVLAAISIYAGAGMWMFGQTDSTIAAAQPAGEWIEVAIKPSGEASWEYVNVDTTKRVLLSMALRRDLERMGGYGYYAQLFFNGKALDASVNRKVSRLINKPLSFKRTNGMEVFWNLGDGVWHTFFAPDYQTNTATYGIQLKDQPYHVVLDVTDLIEPGVNTLTARNLISSVSENGRDVVVAAQLLYADKQEQEEITHSDFDLAKDVQIRVLKNGAFALVSNGTEIPFYSTYSYPDGGHNVLGESHMAKPETSWKVHSRKNSDNEWELIAEGDFYRIHRTITKEGNRILVKETISNSWSEPVGILLSHHLAFGDLPFLSCRMSGRKSESLNDVYAPDNPTLFLPLKSSGLGIVIEDDVMRNQSLLFYNDQRNSAGFSNSFFTLDVGQSYSSQWSVYLTDSNHYFDFINDVRVAWNSNITIEAPLYFDNYNHIARMSDEQLAKYLDVRKPRYISFWELRKADNPLPEWGNRTVTGFGTGILHPVLSEEREKVKLAVEKIHRVSPETKVTLYSHCFFISPEEQDAQTYLDSRIIDETGKRAVSAYNDPKRVDFGVVFPTLNNSYGQDYLKLIDYYLNELGVDWMYWDESNGPGATHQNVSVNARIIGRGTFNAWDGHSAIISRRTKRIEKKFALMPLITRDIFNEVRKRFGVVDGLVYFNGSATTSDRISTPSFVETQYTITDCYRTHLNTPLAYGYGNPSVADIRQRLLFGCIYARTHISYPSEVVERCYPFTPIKLNEGWVKGKERIVTMLDGEYGWGKEAFTATLYAFDSEGKKVSEEVVKSDANGKLHIDVLDGGISIIERHL